MKKILLLTFMVCSLSFSQNTFFTKKDISTFATDNLKSTPSKLSLFDVYSVNNKKAFYESLYTITDSEETLSLHLPTPEGLVLFDIKETSVFSKELQAKYPMIRSFSGTSVSNPDLYLRCSLSSAGFNAMGLSASGSFFIDSYTMDDSAVVVYKKSNNQVVSNDFSCLVEGLSKSNTSSSNYNRIGADDGKLRTYRLAIATTIEYTSFHATDQGLNFAATEAQRRAAALSGINTTMTRVNGVYEIELGVRMLLVANNENIIFVGSDNFSNSSAGALINESQQVIDQVIGNANYDIGHTFSTGGGGLAGLGVVCVDGDKARGITGSGSPKGDAYDIDYVAHEMGHQFGANHTQNNPCNNVSSTSMEPGSASTIMGYAGICAPNVQNNSDDHFHAISIQEMWGFIQNHTCDVETTTGNTAPTITAIPNYTVPASTPILLQGNASDVNSADVLTYCWEQMDPETGTMPPVASATQGPMFRSNSPTTSPNRYLPSLNTVLAGNIASTWEVIPTVSRAMNFRLTVRDNHAGSGNTSFEDTSLSFTNTAGPFTVTSQSSNVTWDSGENATVTWNVANTNVAPVNTDNVDIYLSIDGGQNFDTLIVAGTPNDGSQLITVPNVTATTQARIMVIGSDNVFFNVNSTNFTIENSLSIDEFQVSNLELYPNPTNGMVHLAFDKEDSGDLSVQLYDIRGRLIKGKSYADAGSRFEADLNYNNVSKGIYFILVTQNNASFTQKLIIE